MKKRKKNRKPIRSIYHRRSTRPHTYSIGPVGGTLKKIKVFPAIQCRSVSFCLPCQGVRGHKGAHWCYRPDGWLEQWQRAEDIKGPMDWASSTCPPDHKDYVHPKQKLKERYSHFDKRIELGTEPAKPLSTEQRRNLDRREKQLKKQLRIKKR